MALLKWQSQASPFRGMPTEEKTSASTLTTVTGESVAFKYYNAGVLTADAGQAAGVLVVGQLAYDKVKNNLGNMEATVNDTSLSFSSTAFTSEVRIDFTIMESVDESSGSARLQAICAGFTQGQYCVDYSHGTVYGMKASTQTSLASTTYKYRATSSASSGTATIGAAVPSTATAVSFSDGTNSQLARVFDGDTGAGTEYDLGVIIRKTASGGSVEAGTTSNPWVVGGSVASLATDSGNPVKIGAVYNTSAPSPANGQRVDAQADASGNLKTAEQYVAIAEDNTLGVFAMLPKPAASATYSPSLFKNLGANATLNIKPSTGNILSIYARNVSGSDRWIQLHNTATVPAGAAVPIFSFYVPAGGVTERGTEFFTQAGVNGSNGWAFACSTTEGTYTAATATDHFTYIQYI